jgi:hypothetical protein
MRGDAPEGIASACDRGGHVRTSKTRMQREPRYPDLRLNSQIDTASMIAGGDA